MGGLVAPSGAHVPQMCSRGDTDSQGLAGNLSGPLPDLPKLQFPCRFAYEDETNLAASGIQMGRKKERKERK